jgi:hypothetical protein
MQIAGRVTIQADGRTVRSIPGATIDLGGTERTPHAGSGKDDIYNTEETKPAMITTKINLARGDSVERWRNMKNATATFSLDTGQTYIVRDAFATKTLVLSPGENGTVQLEIAGKPATEVTA